MAAETPCALVGFVTHVRRCCRAVGFSSECYPTLLAIDAEPAPRAGIVVVAKHSVRRTRRFMRVWRWMGLLSIVCGYYLPTSCCAGALCRSEAPRPSVEKRR